MHSWLAKFSAEVKRPCYDMQRNVGTSAMLAEALFDADIQMLHTTIEPHRVSWWPAIERKGNGNRQEYASSDGRCKSAQVSVLSGVLHIVPLVSTTHMFPHHLCRLPDLPTSPLHDMCQNWDADFVFMVASCRWAEYILSMSTTSPLDMVSARIWSPLL